MKKIIGYKILRAENSGMEEQIGYFLRRGWQPYGTPHFHTTEYKFSANDTRIHQTIVLFEGEAREPTPAELEEEAEKARKEEEAIERVYQQFLEENPEYRESDTTSPP